MCKKYIILPNRVVRFGSVEAPHAKFGTTRALSRLDGKYEKANNPTWNETTVSESDHDRPRGDVGLPIGMCAITTSGD